MVNIDYDFEFKKSVSKIKDTALKIKIEKQMNKIINFPEVGKPMKHDRKGTREVYIRPYRLSYAYSKEKDLIIFLELYHKDEQ